VADAQHTILVVDDNEDNLDLLSRRHERKGYAVVRAMSGALALSILGSESIDLGLLDVMMPEMSGLEVLTKSTRETHRRTQ
jgi:CheY-like chemotaxis protein